MLETVMSGAGALPAPQIAGYFHDMYGTGVDILAELELGPRTFDASVAGLGGCPYSPGDGQRRYGRRPLRSAGERVQDSREPWRARGGGRLDLGRARSAERELGGEGDIGEAGEGEGGGDRKEEEEGRGAARSVADVGIDVGAPKEAKIVKEQERDEGAAENV
ncbi:uncharacterized protein B0H18DRAFT_1029908 [Fomitopsis serialis]|uniref:uncharacterized protein n=1 Tax=Fomitopsis serialis TaxID=139415 RepID=UPI00200896B0|nr:uncharacterized protein B0H18DRAFT_1029908 [Neoantrodia serialis]KAH9918852.1 hypothetical protein B0H18DRAFT_1029908 [Neoantrodia serialis]